VPLENAVDKISFRDSFDPAADYLLLDGLTRRRPRAHGRQRRSCSGPTNDRIWLADADYIKSLPKYHNSMLVLRDGQSATHPRVRRACEPGGP
jgi:hypothetical protein